MRIVSALLFIALTGSFALADEAKPADPKPEVAKAKVPLRVVRMLAETHQVLLLDRSRGTHVVAEVGQDVDGYIVDEIADDEVTLISPSGAEVILTAPDHTWRRTERKAATAKAAKVSSDATATAGSDAAPQDPYGDEPGLATAPAGEVRSVSADAGAASAPTSAKAPAAAVVDAGPTVPADPYSDPDAGIAAFAEAVGATSPATSSAPRATQPASPDAATALAAAATGSPAPASRAAFTLARSEVDAALGDFGATAVTFDAKFVADGLRLDSIAKGTLLDKAGLKKGDTITAVDSKPLRSFDDAADLYARMQTARATTIAIVRAGKPATLKVTIR